MEEQMQLEWKTIFPCQEPQLNSTFPALYCLLNQKENLKEKHERTLHQEFIRRKPFLCRKTESDRIVQAMKYS